MSSASRLVREVPRLSSYLHERKTELKQLWFELISRLTRRRELGFLLIYTDRAAAS